MIQKTTFNYVKRFFIFPVRNLFILVNGLFNNFDSTIWLLSDGRSGSTWVSSMLNNNGKALEVFEPFHPEINGHCDELVPYAYNQSLCESSKIIELYSKVFSGKLLHRRANFDNRRVKYSGMVVKDVFACLSSYAIHQHFKEVKVVILLRNPFDVVRSKERTAQRGWTWPTDLSVYTDNSSLLEKLTPRQISLIREIAKRDNFVEKQMVYWALCYFVMLNSFESNDYYLLFYEKMKALPNDELNKIKAFLGKDFSFNLNECTADRVEKSSRTLVTSPQDSNWESEIKLAFQKSELDTMRELIECFSLTGLYGVDGFERHC
jgi:hypothetical protein